MSWIDVLHRMRSVLKSKGFDQIPQLSSSRMIDVNHQFEIVPQESIQAGGARRVRSGTKPMFRSVIIV